MKKIYLLISCIGIAFFALSIPYINKINNDFVEKKKASKTPAKNSIKNKKLLNAKNKSKPNSLKFGTPFTTISAIQTVAVQGGGNAVPGGQLNYSFILSNTGTDALNVSFTDQLIADLTLVPGSIKSTPIVLNDSYQSIGNVGITVPVGNGVLANDNSPTGETMTASVATSTTSGTLNLAPNGSFTYTPNAGFVGNDSFTYTVTTGTTTSTGTVTIQVSNMIWFVNPTAGASGTGTLQNPFKNMSNVTGTAIGNTIFVYAGSPTGAITLLNNQILIGQGATVPLVGAGSITGITVPAFSNALPTTGLARPTWSHTTTALTLASGNDIEGFDLTTSGGTSITGASVGALKVREVTLNNTNGQALQITAGGALDAIFSKISSTGGAKGISVNSSTGSFQIAGIGTSSGAGGIISTKTTRGAEFINCTNVILKYVNFSSANTTDGTNDANNNSVANGAIYASSVTGLTINNAVINGSMTNNGILLNAVNGFTLSNSSISAAGNNNVLEAGINAMNLQGACSILGTTISNGYGRNLLITQLSTPTPLTLNIGTTTLQNPVTADNLEINCFNSTNSTLNITGSNFTAPITFQIQGFAQNNSTLNMNVKTSIFEAGSGTAGGIELSSNNSGALKFNIVDNPQIESNGTAAVYVGSKISGTAEGRINNNSISSIGACCSPIYLDIDGNPHIATATMKVQVNNNILNITNTNNFDTGIYVRNVNGTSAAKMDATITNNTINLASINQFAGIYTSVGVSSDANVVCENIANNTVTGVVLNSNYAHFAEASPGTVINLQRNTGAGTTAQTIWINNSNSPTTAGMVDQSGTINVAPAACLLPANPTFRIGVEESLAANENKVQEKPIEDPISAENAQKIIDESGINTDFGVNKNLTLITNSNTNKSSNSKVQSGETITVNGSGSGFSLPSNKTTTITFSATINNPTVACDMTNIASVAGLNFLTVNSNSTSVPLVIPPISTGSTISAASVCSGGTISLTAACPVGSTLNWYNASTGGSIVSSISPYNPTNITVATDYYASCTIGACESVRTLVGSVAINALPDATISAVDEVCQGSTLSLSAPNVAGSIYNWTGNGVDADNSATNLASPNTTGSQMYAVTVTDANSCTSSSSKTVTVNAKPSVTASTNQTICKGESASLIATCDAPCTADTYTWNPGAITGQTVSVSPIALQTYTLVASNSVTGCASNPLTTDVNVTPSTLPNVYTTITQDIGTSTQFVDNCVYLTKVEPKSGSANPIGGSVTASVWLESSGLPFSFVGSTFVFVPRHYEITPSTNPTTSEGTITLYFTQADFNAYNANNAVKLPQNSGDISNASNFQIVKYAGSAPNGIPTSGTPKIIPTTGTFNDGISGCTLNWNSTKGFWEATFPVTGFSDFFVKTSSVALPVNLISFTGKNTENGNELIWKTANEKAFDGFEIQKSVDSKAFEAIGNVKGNQSENYNYLDITGNTNSQSYYRLKLIDLDGKYTYSKIISIENETEKTIVGNAYPNPSIGQISVEIITVEKGYWQIDIYDITGKIVDSEKRTLEKGLNKVVIQNLIKGVNFINFKNNEFKVVRKVIKQ